MKTIRRKRNLRNPARVPLEAAELTPAGQVPQANGVIRAAGQNPLTIWGEGYTPDPVCVAFEVELFVPTMDVPNVYGPV